MTTKKAVNLALEIIGRNGLSGVACETTSLPQALRQIGLSRLSSATLSRVTAELRRQHLVEITRSGQTMKLQLSVAGVHRLQRAQVDSIVIKEPVRWDGTWRMVTYDVPRQKSAERRLFYHELKRLGFMMVRESVWFHPYPCFEAINQLAGYCGLQRCITAAEISRLDTVTLEKLRNHYGEKVS